MSRVLVILTVLTIPAGAAAQGLGGSHQISEVRSSARGHIGPFYLTPGVLLKELGVDGNVFNAAGEQQSDFTFTLQPSLDTWVPMARRALIKATMAPDLVWYAEHASERSVNPRLAVRSDVYLSRLTLFGERQYANARQRPNHEVDVRTRQLQETSVAGMGLAVTPSLSAESSAGGPDPTSGGHRVRRDEPRAHAQPRCPKPSAHREASFDPADDTGAALRRDRTSLSAPAGARCRQLPGDAGGRVRAAGADQGHGLRGPSHVHPVGPGVLPEFSGIVGELGLSYTLLGSTVLGASYRRDLTYSYSELQPFFVDDAAGVSVRRALGRRFDVLLSGDRHTTTTTGTR
jgi:hypothetical protein